MAGKYNLLVYYIKSVICEKEHKIIHYFFVLFLFLSCDPSRAQEFEASGHLKSDRFLPNYKNGKEPCRSMEADFTVTVQDCRWQIQYLVTSSDVKLKDQESIENGIALSYDGTNCYRLILVSNAI